VLNDPPTPIPELLYQENLMPVGIFIEDATLQRATNGIGTPGTLSVALSPILSAV
jgi:hypothetical protein